MIGYEGETPKVGTDGKQYLSFLLLGVIVVRKPFHIVLAICCLACCATVSAQAPQFAPYGAWRGKIRYVEGPWRTRTTIHWGNGITPTGGQVVMHGLTAAQNVLTNPDFLDKVTGLRDAEEIAESEKRNNKIQASIRSIRNTNVTIAKLNAPVLDAWNLTPTKVEALAEASADPSNGSDSDASDPLFEAFEQSKLDLADLAGEMKLSAGNVIAYGEFALANGGELRLTAEQQTALRSRIEFVRKVAETFTHLEAEPDEASGTPSAALEMALTEYSRLVKNRDEAASTAEELKELGEQLLEEVGEEAVLTEGIQFAEDIVKAIEQWGTPPSVEDDIFENAGAENAGAENAGTGDAGTGDAGAGDAGADGP